MNPRLRTRRIAHFFPADPPGEGNPVGGGGSGGAGAPPESGTGTGTGSAGTGAAAGAGTGTDDRGYPQGTPVAEMTTEQQAAYWKFHARKHEDAVKNLGDLTELRRKASAWEQHEKDSASELDKAVTAAREAGKSEAATEHRAELAEYALRGALSALPQERRDAVLSVVDYSRFVGADGRPDEAKIKAFVTVAVGGTADDGGTGGTGHGGHRPPGTASSLSAGAERYAERHAKKNT